MGMDSIHDYGKKRAVVRPQQPKQTGVTMVEWRLRVCCVVSIPCSRTLCARCYAPWR